MKIVCRDSILSLVFLAFVVSPASAAAGLVAKRSGYPDIVITPAMMHAINMLVAEDMKMKRHRR